MGLPFPPSLYSAERDAYEDALEIKNVSYDLFRNKMCLTWPETNIKI